MTWKNFYNMILFVIYLYIYRYNAVFFQLVGGQHFFVSLHTESVYPYLSSFSLYILYRHSMVVVQHLSAQKKRRSIDQWGKEWINWAREQNEPLRARGGRPSAGARIKGA